MSAETALPEDDIALAGEYALGLLAAEERRAFEARLDLEPALRRLVAEWQEGLVPLAEGIAPVTPPAELKAQIDARLFAARPPAQRRLSLARLLFGGLAGAVVMLALLLLLLPLADPGAGAPDFRAEIATPDRALVVLASLDADTATLRVARTAGAPAPGRSLELWLIAPGGAPVSLGTIDPAETAVAVAPELLPGFAGGTLAISEEPPGGSPTGVPTVVLAAGEVVVI